MWLAPEVRGSCWRLCPSPVESMLTLGSQPLSCTAVCNRTRAMVMLMGDACLMGLFLMNNQVNICKSA